MLDFLSRDKTNRTYRTVQLENEYLSITILPELGGKIHEVRDKTTGKPMFYVNHVIKPGLIGQCGAWTSGGVEWNTGPQGHTVSCLQPVDVLILPPAKDGSRSVAIGETERIYGTKWTVVVTLRPSRPERFHRRARPGQCLLRPGRQGKLGRCETGVGHRSLRAAPTRICRRKGPLRFRRPARPRPDAAR